jgi:hypothetical protein
MIGQFSRILITLIFWSKRNASKYSLIMFLIIDRQSYSKERDIDALYTYTLFQNPLLVERLQLARHRSLVDHVLSSLGLGSTINSLDYHTFSIHGTLEADNYLFLNIKNTETGDCGTHGRGKLSYMSREMRFSGSSKGTSSRRGSSFCTSGALGVLGSEKHINIHRHTYIHTYIYIYI